MIKNSIIGKWHKQKYKVLEKIGQGSIGTIYKVIDEKNVIKALKISEDISSITREFEILKELGEIKGVPTVYQLDDFQGVDKTQYFFTMEFIQGKDLKALVKKEEIKTRNIVGINLILLNILEAIYNRGYLYTDIKPENVLVDSIDKRVVLIDFGSVILKNQFIKEYTPIYNIRVWGVDIETRSDTYLIFSISMLIVNMIFKREYNPLVMTLKEVLRDIKKCKESLGLKKFLIMGLTGDYERIKDFKKALIKEIKRAKQENKKVMTKGLMGQVDMLLIGSVVFFTMTLVLVIINL